MKHNNLNRNVKVLLLLFCIVLTFCSIQATIRANTYTTSSDIQILLDRFISGKLKDISYCKDIISTNPEIGNTVDSTSNITISFKDDMDSESFTNGTIIIYEYKHSSIITDLFNINYDHKKKQLSINFKIDGNSVGTANSVVIFLTKDIKRQNGTHLDSDFFFIYYT
ncbi:MAG: hypothetical protein FWC47_17695 [Oscillospiraceae bacterium]|nr:hypothetical protein [Oscillospiraceae bacterium]